MANIMSMTKLRNKVSRNGFDLSRKNLFTAKAGELLPVACIECIPGDRFDIDMAWFTRTRPVNTAAYTRIREYYDWYFVPTNLLWNKFNTFISQMTDNNLKATGINGNATLSAEHPYFTVAQVVNYLRAGFWAGDPNNTKNNFFGFNRAALTTKLLHYLDYGDYSFVGKQDLNNGYGYQNAKLNPFPLLAYQKIYQDFFRDSQWERAYAPSCNIDYMTGVQGSNNLPLNEIDRTSENMFDLRYCNWNKDYFMGLLPNAQYGSASIVEGDFYNGFWANITNNQSVSGDATTSSTGRLINVNANGLWQVTPADTSYGLQSKIAAFTVLALRQAEAKQKWSEITQSQQQDYKSQIQAHWNVDVSDAYSDRCSYVGGVAGNIDIEAVTNQNLTDNNEADIAGRGQGGSRGTISYSPDVHGYLMCIYHCVPLLDYSISGIKRQNLKTFATDYAIPEFDATGMVSVPAVELVNNQYIGEGSAQQDLTNVLLGYAPRYADYKVSYDLVHGAFVDGNLHSWTAPISNSYVSEYLASLGSSLQTGAFNYHFFKVPPSVLNPIFAFDVDARTETDQFLINCAFDIKAVRNLDRNGLPF